MGRIAVGFGAALTLLGVVGYFGTGQASVTALIPSAFGVPLMILGFLARAEHLRKHVMHAAAAVGTLGILAGIADFIRRLAMKKLEWDASTLSLILMAVLCGGFVALCVKSFIDARRALAQRNDDGSAGSPPP